ncbi:hypothetical protein XA68_12225 [Ophiocordyceps unilateralis]|uniref:Histone deacetylase complex subunit SAP30 Sin3 binding domain-containing protein n=1 Tax=Ophiocordyceps unilateralis TaxID=268505 RepID=A0A2A9PF36_OPHUN|nr:hypothetical protein XA68_12225 [Ophiocordyceps unilateralis]
MAPVKASRNADDHRPDTGGGPKDRVGAGGPPKMRRVASQTSVSQLREAPPIRDAAPTSAPAQGVEDVAAPTLNWVSFDRDVLHAYCRQHRLNTPSSFSNPSHQRMLSQPGSIGLFSPTMVAKRKSRRQSKEQLALAVRKHFNGMGVQENDVIVDLIFRVGCDKAAKAGGSHKQGSASK